MDVSKLPRLSTTNVPPPDPMPSPSPDQTPPPVVPKPTYDPLPVQRQGILEAYISIGVGLILVLFCPNTLRFISSKLFHTHFDNIIFYTDGTQSLYVDTHFFWSDLVITVFALALVVDGILMVCFRRLPVLLLALCLTVAATLGNLVYLVTTYGSYGLALMSALAVLFGGYMAISQGSVISDMLRQRQRAQG